MQKKTYKVPRLWALQYEARDTILKGSVVDVGPSGDNPTGGRTREKNPWGETSDRKLWDE